MTTWFEAEKWCNTIKTVEVLSETKSFITLAPTGTEYYQRQRRVAKSDKYFPTFAEARTHLMQLWSDRNETAKTEAERAHVKWEKLFMQEGPDANS
jgi:hypothetical protein